MQFTPTSVRNDVTSLCEFLISRSTNEFFGPTVCRRHSDLQLWPWKTQFRKNSLQDLRETSRSRGRTGLDRIGPDWTTPKHNLGITSRPLKLKIHRREEVSLCWVLLGLGGDTEWRLFPQSPSLKRRDAREHFSRTTTAKFNSGPLSSYSHDQRQPIRAAAARLEARSCFLKASRRQAEVNLSVRTGAVNI